MTSRFLPATLAGVLGAILILVTGGCESPSKEPAAEDVAPTPELSESNQELARGSLSAVEVRGQSLVTIQETIQSVFTDAGFILSSSSADALAFDRPASRRQTAAYGTWFGGEIKTRMKVETIQQGTEIYFLRCKSYVVREAGTSVEDVQSLARRHVREYEGLLHEVSARLN